MRPHKTESQSQSISHQGIATSETIIFSNRCEMVQAIIAQQFEGIMPTHKTDRIFRKVLFCGAFKSWYMYGFSCEKNNEVRELDQEDARLIYSTFKKTGLLKALDAMVHKEHSWGWSFHDLDLLEGLIILAQNRLDSLEEEPANRSAWGALNLFKLFLKGKDSVNILLTEIPCTCWHCLSTSPLIFFKNAFSILRLRSQISSFLDQNIPDEEITSLYD